MGKFLKYRKTALLEVIGTETNEHGRVGYLVQNAGDPSDRWIIPAQTFEDTYEPAEQNIEMPIAIVANFGYALKALKEGKRVARRGWNGKGMWLCLGKGQTIPAEQFWNVHTRDFATQNGGQAEVLPYIIMKTADNKILMGWLASQTDMLAEDWEVVE